MAVTKEKKEYEFSTFPPPARNRTAKKMIATKMVIHSVRRGRRGRRGVGGGGLGIVEDSPMVFTIAHLTSTLSNVIHM